MLDFILNLQNLIPISLDLATALSIVFASIAYIFRSIYEKRSDIRAEKWKLMREMTDEILKYKSEIRRDVIEMIIKRNKMIIRSNKKEETEETQKAKEEELDFSRDGIGKLIAKIRGRLDEASYFAEYDVQKKATIIARKYEPTKDQRTRIIWRFIWRMILGVWSWLSLLFRSKEQRMDVPRQINLFISEIEDAKKRLSISFDTFRVCRRVFPGSSQWTLDDYFKDHFLMEVGINTRDINIMEHVTKRYDQDFFEKKKISNIEDREKVIKSYQESYQEQLEKFKKNRNLSNKQLLGSLEGRIKLKKEQLEKLKKRSIKELLEDRKKQDTENLQFVKLCANLHKEANLEEENLDEYRTRMYYQKNYSEDLPGYYKGDLPPTIFDVLDKFADSMNEEIKKEHVKE